MTKPDRVAGNPDLSLPRVKPESIKQFERAGVTASNLYNTLFEQDEALALWLRRRAAELAPELDEREAIATLALEALEITKTQLTVDTLTRLFAMEPVAEPITSSGGDVSNRRLAGGQPGGQ